MLKRENLIRSAILLFSVGALVFLVIIASKGKRLPALNVDTAGAEALMSERRETDEPLAEGISFNGYPLPYDADADVYYYSLIEGESSSYTPKVTLEGAADGVRIAIVDCEISDEMIAAGEMLEAIVYNDGEYHRTKIACTTLPLISIETEEEIDSEYVGMTARIFDNRHDTPVRLTVCDGKIHTRGRTSRLFEKKAFRLTLYDTSVGGASKELNTPLLGMRPDGDWILYAAYNDQERIRNVLATNLWYDSCAKNNSLGITNGVEYRFVELLVNGEYR
ncbi:MAG: CotH kinase family protein, partial [Clostridia bacterium]|nr:CotH kinase family protein [Clostridia bacterium]